MLLLQKPNDVYMYFGTNDNSLNLFLQQQGNCPKYFYNEHYYYVKTKQLKRDIILYSIMQKRKRGG